MAALDSFELDGKIMITKQEVLDLAGEWKKDYVNGWLLAKICEHPRLGRGFIFKGGTCLKKCYFETYRFSEDLDFTEVAGRVYEATGV